MPNFTSRGRTGLAVVIVLTAALALILLLARDGDQDRVAGEAAQLARMVSLPERHSQRFDAIRTFIESHSVHNINAEFAALSDRRNFASELLKKARGERPTPVPMECASRSNIMKEMLLALGYEARQVSIFDTDTDDLQSHTFVEALNPETGRWETQDPDMGIFWRNVITGARASVFDEAERALDLLEPCNANGCGWSELTNKLRGYVDVLTVRDGRHGVRSIFTSRAKPEGPFHFRGQRGSFCEVMAKRCRDGFESASRELEPQSGP
jgi:hypothetical protein